MNARLVRAPLVLIAAMLFQGCVAIPPLVHVERKENPQGFTDIQRRLDSIDRRLDQLEQKREVPAKPSP